MSDPSRVQNRSDWPYKDAFGMSSQYDPKRPHGITVLVPMKNPHSKQFTIQGMARSSAQQQGSGLLRQSSHGSTTQKSLTLGTGRAPRVPGVRGTRPRNFFKKASTTPASLRSARRAALGCLRDSSTDRQPVDAALPFRRNSRQISYRKLGRSWIAPAISEACLASGQ
jgi:hypothetical protein